MSEQGRRVVAITGASGGIGAAIAARFVQDGEDVAMHDLRRGPVVDALAATAAGKGGRITFTSGDVADRRHTASWIRHTQEAWGPIDVLVTCAGILECDTPSERVTHEEWDTVMAVNVTGTWACVQAALPAMLEAGSGRIITISSELALTGADKFAAYCASKGAIVGLTKALARELAPRGVLVNSVAPGPVETTLIEGIADNTAEERARLPLRRFGEPDEIASVVHFLAGAGGSLMVGQVVSPNGGAVI